VTRDARDPTQDELAAEAGFFAPMHQTLEKRLDDLEARYRGLIDRLPAVVYIEAVDDNGRMIDVSPSIEELLGIPRAEWLTGGRVWRDSIHPEDRDRVRVESERAAESGEPFRVEYRGVHRNGDEVWIREDSVLIRSQQGEPLYWLGIMLDVSDQARTQAELADAHQKYGALVEQIPAIVYVDVADASMATTYVSPQIEQILGYTAGDYIDDPGLWESILHADDRARAVEIYERGRESGEPFTYEYRLIARDGRVVWFRDSAVVLRDAGGKPTEIQGVMLDVTDMKEAEAKLTYLAYHDSLTGLPNKAMYDELLELALARARRHGQGAAVLSVDVDNFKLVNDSLGHERGDELLKMLAERLAEATRETDLIARQGGDEFLLLLADLERTSPVNDGDGAAIVAESVANRVQRSLEEPFVVDGTELYLTASVGISVFPMDADDAPTLQRNADQAMYRAKSAGPGGYVMHEVDGADAMSRLSLSTRLRKAVEQKVWTLHYQPLIDLDSGSMFGVEALIRWPDPNGGLMPPGEFIPLAEEMGLIEAIGEWVVEEIGRQDAEWRASGLELEIGFNLSPRQLFQPDLVGRIVSRVTDTGMDPTRVTVEITESTAMTDPERTLTVLHGLHEAGFRLAIDDFGTGYSSLARLRHMPVDILKIDRTFVREVHADPQSASMVSAIVALASNLGMSALAEGIETAEEWKFLADRGCPYGQGFLFSRPVPAEDILASWRRQGLHVIAGGLAS
jgi:diguanylate cyclase (GGDEF)-like protein/PAS domain S-box-containing protein